MAWAVPARRRAGAALLGLAASAACAEVGVDWGASVGIAHRRLIERADSGAQLVKESGPLALVRLDAQLRLTGGGALRAETEAAWGRLDYEGETQRGVPLATDTSHRDLSMALLWRPLSPAAWGEGWLVLRGLQQRRQIASTPAAGGLQETSLLLMPGLRWTGAFDTAGWRWQPTAELRASVHHALHIDFGGVFDSADLDGGRRREFVLGLSLGRIESPWRFGIEWLRARQSASPRQEVLRGGLPAGTVHQPRIEIDDLGVLVRREW